MALNASYYTDLTDLKIQLAAGSGGLMFQDDIILKVPNFGATGTTYNAQWRAMSTAAGTNPEILNNEFDKSISYLGVDSGCDWVKFTAVQGAPTNGETVENVSTTSSMTPIALSYRGNWYDNTTSRPSNFAVYTNSNEVQYRANGNQTVWDAAPWGFDYRHTIATAAGNTFAHVVDGNVAPVAKFSIKNIVLGISVVACKLNNNKSWDDIHYTGSGDNGAYTNISVRAFDLDRYCREGYEEYPYVIGIYFSPFTVGESASNNNFLTVQNSQWLLYGMGAGMTYNHTFQGNDGEVTKKIIKHQSIITSFAIYNTNYVTGENYSNANYNSMLAWGGLNSTPSSYYTLISYFYNDYFIFGNGGTLKYLSSNETNYVAGNYSAIMYYAHYSDFGGSISSFRNYCKKQTAYAGLFFIDKMGNIDQHINSSYDDSDLYLGVIDNSGITHGEYVNGALNAVQPQFNWTDPINDNSNYDPNRGGEDDPNTYIDSMPGRNALSLSTTSSIYLINFVTAMNLGILINEICVRQSTETLEDYQLRLSANSLSSNPIDNIISYKFWVFNIKDFVTASTATEIPIKLGNQIMSNGTITATGYSIVSNIITIELGNFTLYSVYNDFRDYEPYTTAKLYLPYCATITIDLRTITDKTVYIQYKVDLKTGSTTALITLNSYNGPIVETSHGTLCIDIPVTGIQSADFQNAIYQGITTLKSAKNQEISAGFNVANSFVSAAVGALTGNLQSMQSFGNSIFSLQSAEIASDQAKYNIATTPIKYTSAGSTSAGDGALMYQYPALIISRTEMQETYNANNYASTNGFACTIPGKLSDFQGYTVCSSVNLEGITATSTEIQAIQSLLQAGIYL